MQTNAVKVLAIAVLALGLMVGQGWGANIVATVQDATYSKYKAGNLTNCDDADGWTGDSNLDAASDAAGVGGTLYVCDGTYSGTKVHATALLTLLSTQTFQGESEAGTIISGTGVNASVVTAQNNVTINDITITAGQATKYALSAGDSSWTVTLNRVTISNSVNGIYLNSGTITGTDVTITGITSVASGFFGGAGNITLTDGALHSNSGFIEIAGGTKIFNGMDIYGNSGESSIAVTAASTLNLNYCNIYGNTSTYTMRFSAGTVGVNNCIIIGNQGEAIRVDGAAADVDVANSIISANSLGSITGYPLVRSAGAFDITYSLLHPNPRTTSRITTGTVTLGTGVIYSVPQYSSPARQGILIIGVDDQGNAATAQALATKLEAYGWNLTWAVNSYGIADWTDYSAFVQSGHEIASHTRRHVNIQDLEAFAIQYTGAGACALTINQTTDTMTTAGDCADLNIDLNSYTGGTGIGGLCTYIHALADYTCALDATPSASYAANGSALTLGEQVSLDITSSQTISVDSTAMIAEELVGSVSDIDDGIQALYPAYGGVTTFVHPGDYTDTEARAALSSAGFLGARGKSTSEWSMPTGVYRYGIWDISADSMISHSNVERNTAAIVEGINQIGGIGFLYTHDLTTVTADDWDIILRVISESGIRVMTLSESVAWLIANGSESGAGGDTVDTVTIADSSDRTVKPTSPCIGAGTSIAGLHNTAGQVDYFGNSLVAATSGPVPTIGAEAFQAVKWVYGVDDGTEYTEIDGGDDDIQGVVTLPTATTPTIHNTTVARCDRGGITAFVDTEIINTVAWNDTATVPSVSAATGITLTGSNNYLSDDALDGAGAESFTSETWSGVDPFLDYDNGDFHPAAGSPLIDTGLDQGADETDLDGESQEANGYAATPTATTPADAATGVLRKPTLESSAFVISGLWDVGSRIFTASTHTGSEWEIDDNGGDFSSNLFDSGDDAVNLESILTTTSLARSTPYDWRVRHKTDAGWSAWSTVIGFTTGVRGGDGGGRGPGRMGPGMQPN